MFKYNGKQLYDTSKEYCKREIITQKENKKIKNDYIELYVEGFSNDDKISIDLLLDIDLEKLNLLILEEKYDLSEYLLLPECFFGINREFKNFGTDDLNINITKIGDRKFNLEFDSYEFKFYVLETFIMGESSE